MTALQIAILGAIAGFTIFLGLPVGRLRNPSLATKAFLNATATGVLLFLLWDVLVHAVDLVQPAPTANETEQAPGCASAHWLRSP